MTPETRRFLALCRGPALVWAGLVLLLAATFGVAYSPLGPRTRTAIHLSIAAAQVGLIAVFFMNLRAARGLLRFAAVAGVYWLVIMFVLTFNDYRSRPPSSPCRQPAFTEPSTGLCPTQVQ